MALKFGTDGVRGDTRTELTPAYVEALGKAAADHLGSNDFVVGRDTRESGQRLSQALLRGFAMASNTRMVDMGVVPTPTVARWCADNQTSGAVVTASHNLWHDNGVKFFAAGGSKLDDTTQAAMAASISRQLETAVESVADPLPELLTLPDEPDAAFQLHIWAVNESIARLGLYGLKLVVDCSNGAATELGPRLLQELGAEVTAIHANPNGRNINDGCGSTDPVDLQAAVLRYGADVGVAFDGDADRVVAVDNNGAVVDGDQIMAICAIDRLERGCLAGDAVAVTVMTNLGFHHAMNERGIGVVETPVGDKHVMEAMIANDLSLGGEQSGHIIFRDYATTGDGLLTAVQLLDTVRRSGQSLADLSAAAMTRLPQVVDSVQVPDEADEDKLEELIAETQASAAGRLGDTGRVLVRLSGTEPIIRVMVEATDEKTAHEETSQIVSTISDALNLNEQSS